MAGVRRCICGSCVYCKNHDRYVSEKDLRRKRSQIRNLLEREKEMWVKYDLITAHQDGEIGLDELLEVIDSE